MGLPRVLFLDACVLYPAPVRDVFMRLALADMVRLRWSEKVHEEWMENLLQQRSDLTPARLKQIPAKMAEALESQEPLVTGYEYLLSQIDLPDLNDRHVVAAAVVGKAEAILTFNLKDFPQHVLEAWDLEVYSPDEYLIELMDLLIRGEGVPQKLLELLKKQREALKNPPLDHKGFLGALERAGLRGFARALRGFEHMI
ncbi:MAG: PIN domain-containing protein [Thermus sp.]|nr:PIN domain-containing protein [Thermus sp.]